MQIFYSKRYNFENCGIDVACDLYIITEGTQQINGSSYSNTDTLTFSVSDDGQSLTLDTEIATIEELTKSSLIISKVQGGTTTTYTLEKL